MSTKQVIRLTSPQAVEANLEALREFSGLIPTFLKQLIGNPWIPLSREEYPVFFEGARISFFQAYETQYGPAVRGQLSYVLKGGEIYLPAEKEKVDWSGLGCWASLSTEDCSNTTNLPVSDKQVEKLLEATKLQSKKAIAWLDLREASRLVLVPRLTLNYPKVNLNKPTQRGSNGEQMYETELVNKLEWATIWADVSLEGYGSGGSINPNETLVVKQFAGF